MGPLHTVLSKTNMLQIHSVMFITSRASEICLFFLEPRIEGGRSVWRTGARTCDVTASPPPVPCYVIRFVVYRARAETIRLLSNPSKQLYIKDNLKQRKVHIRRIQFSDYRVQTSYGSRLQNTYILQLLNSYILLFPVSRIHVHTSYNS
jgi:hypothetical protein